MSLQNLTADEYNQFLTGQRSNQDFSKLPWAVRDKITKEQLARAEQAKAAEAQRAAQAAKDAEAAAQQKRITDAAQASQQFIEQARLKGQQRGQELFGNNALGRINDQRSADVGDLLARYKQNLNGFTQEEQNAYRDDNIRNLQQQTGGQLRQLRAQQGNMGVRGPAALAQQNALRNSAAGAAAQNERDLFLKNADLKRASLDKYGGQLTQAEANEKAAQQFNLAQLAKEKYGMLSSELGNQSLAAGNYAGGQSQIANQDALAAALKFNQPQETWIDKVGSAAKSGAKSAILGGVNPILGSANLTKDIGQTVWDWFT